MRDGRGALEALGRTEELLAPTGFSLGQVAVLDLLAEREPLSSGQIAAALGLPAATVTRFMGKLGALGLVRASVDPADLRRNVFRLEVQAHAILFELRKSLESEEALEAALRLHGALARASRAWGVSPSACRVLLALGEEAPSGLRPSTASMAYRALQREGLVEPAPAVGTGGGAPREGAFPTASDEAAARRMGSRNAPGHEESARCASGEIAQMPTDSLNVDKRRHCYQLTEKGQVKAARILQLFQE